MLRVDGAQDHTPGREIRHQQKSKLSGHQDLRVVLEAIDHAFMGPVVQMKHSLSMQGKIFVLHLFTAMAQCQICQINPNSLLLQSAFQLAFH
jgi:hypothetical protein